MEVSLQGLALLGTGVRVCHDTIGGPRVQFSSGGSAPSIGRVHFHTGVDNGSFQLPLFPSRSWGCGP